MRPVSGSWFSVIALSLVFAALPLSAFAHDETLSGNTVIGAGAWIQYVLSANGETGPLVVTLHVPAHTTFAYSSGLGSGCESITTPPVGSAGDVVCRTSKSSLNEEVDVKVDPDAPPDTVVHASVTFDLSGGQSVTRTWDTTVIAPTTVAFTVDGPTSAAAGSNYVITPSVKNTGSAPARSVEVYFWQPLVSFAWPQKHLATWRCGRVGASTRSGYGLVCYVPDLAPGESSADTIDVHANPDATSDVVTIIYQATNSNNGSVTLTTPLDALVVPTVSHVIEPESPRRGDVYHVKTTVGTSGPSLRDFTYSYTTPPATIVDHITAFQGVICQYPQSRTGGTVSCSAPLLRGVLDAWPVTLPSYVIDVAVRTDAGETGTHTASLSFSNSLTPGRINASATATVASPVVVLSPTMGSSPMTSTPGGKVAYSLTVINRGSDAADVVTADVTLKGVASIDSITSENFAKCTAASSTVHCETPQLAASYGAGIAITVTMGLVPGLVRVNAAAASLTTPPVTATVSTPVVGPGPAALVIDTAQARTTSIAGRSFAAVFTVANVGSAATPAAFDVTLSPGLSLTSVTAAAGTCVATHCTVASLISGDKADFVVNAVATQPGAAFVHALASTPASGNAAADVTIDVTSPRSRAVRH
jgi:hypothetical protein